jgi:hypothetical protein
MLKRLLITVAAASAIAAAAPLRTFTGVITDSECADANHKRMGMGDTDAECVKACIDEHGASYVLYDGHSTYQLSDQKAAAGFAGQKVTVKGTLDAKGKTIAVDTISK